MLSEARLINERKHMRSAIAARIARGRDEGDVPADANADHLAGYIDTVIAGMSARARDGATRQDLTATANTALAAFPAHAHDTQRQQSGRGSVADGTPPPLP